MFDTNSQGSLSLSGKAIISETGMRQLLFSARNSSGKYRVWGIPLGCLSCRVSTSSSLEAAGEGVQWISAASGPALDFNHRGG